MNKEIDFIPDTIKLASKPCINSHVACGQIVLVEEEDHPGEGSQFEIVGLVPSVQLAREEEGTRVSINVDLETLMRNGTDEHGRRRFKVLSTPTNVVR